MRLEHVRSEIEYLRKQVTRQRREILQLQRAGIPTGPAEALLQRMLDKIDALCVERDEFRRLPRREASSRTGEGDEHEEVLQRQQRASRVHRGAGGGQADRGA
jgi:hypothetical protein